MNNPETANQYNYGEALQKSYLFYEAQRSGKLPEDNRISWRGDSAKTDGNDVGVDLSGGYYDAGDFVKFGFPMASALTMLSWGISQYNNAYQATNQLDEAKDAIRWGTDYLLKAHISDGNKTLEFWGQVGDAKIDHSYWGSPEEMTMERPAYKIDAENPGSDLAGETAAALASAAIIFRESDPNYSETLLSNSIQLYNFAETFQGKYSDSIPCEKCHYASSGYLDELAWGALWLYKATNDINYLNKAERYIENIYLGNYTHIWDDKTYGTKVLLAQETGKEIYRNDVEKWLDIWVSGNESEGVIYTDGGLAWRTERGSLPLVANTAFLAGVYSDTVNNGNGRYDEFITKQINYILGDNPRNLSYLIGFGDKFPLRVHHRSSHGRDKNRINLREPNANILYGGLVAGLKSADDNAYLDTRSDFIGNEVSLDYNAGFTGALAYMYDKYGGEPISDRELSLLLDNSDRDTEISQDDRESVINTEDNNIPQDDRESVINTEDNNISQDDRESVINTEDNNISQDDRESVITQEESNIELIELYRFKNNTFSSGSYIFVVEAEKDNILNNPNLNQIFELEGNGKSAFKASKTQGEFHSPFFRLQSQETPGSFLFVNQEEYDTIFADRSSEKDKWIKEGLDNEGKDIAEFYLSNRITGQGIVFNRFQNKQNNTYLFTGEEETEAIINNPELSDLFINQGFAFESFL